MAGNGDESADQRVHPRSEEHTSELQSLRHLVCRLLLKKKRTPSHPSARRGTDFPQRSHASGRVRWGASARLRLLLDMLFFFNDTATTEIYTLSLHDALPI